MSYNRIYKYNINDFTEDTYIAAYNMMSPERKEKCDRYRQKADRLLCVAADMLAREGIFNACGQKKESILFAEEPDGKPYTVNTDVCFSVSHSGEYAALAVSDKPIGIDIEKIRQPRLNTVKFFCSQSDIKYIFNTLEYPLLSPDSITDTMRERYFEVWTFKEAYYKCSGIGIGKYAADISFGDFTKHISSFNGYVMCVYS